MSVLVTGVSGFIGSHLAERLLARGERVVGLDNFDPYYGEDVKRRNLRRALAHPEFRFVEGDSGDEALVSRAMAEHGVDRVVHLAARPGVRPSLQDPLGYLEANVAATIRMLEAARKAGNVRNFLFGSSSSVYGVRREPFREDEVADRPLSPYAASKRAAEIYCATYANLYALPVTSLRFFTVYGPRQRPEMAIHKFTRLLSEGKPIPLFGDGRSVRDYTFVDDVVDGIVAALDKPQPYAVYNLGNSSTVVLEDMIHVLAKHVGVPLRIDRQPDQPGDVPFTLADVTRARRDLGYSPKVGIEEGLRRFVEWYRGPEGPGGASA